ncbi:hypothetical protein [Enterobacter hormaechei]|uniref:hypothetical protein n=1 Tax=Enterobacter hormaechei TaxID=158836 RepID=UPI00203C25E2|nr:hypothetical protein [Enterobacter hormaechei]
MIFTKIIRGFISAKLYEAMQRLEKKIGQFVADGVDEHQLRSSLSKVCRSRSRAALKEECEQLIP